MASDSNKKKKLFVHGIGYGHLDPVWLWDWREGCREMLASCRSALLRLSETPDFKYTCSSAGTYLWVQQFAPAMFKEIQNAVKKERWEIVGGWWMEPDLNLPGGESLIRQGLYGKRFFKKYFGIDCVIGFNPDSFGHPVTLPKILNQLGQAYYVFMRPDEHEKSLPGDVFTWEAADGSRVLASRIHNDYGCDHKLDEKINRVLKYLDEHPPLTHGPCFYGVGDHGGGPTKANIKTLIEKQTDNENHKIDFSSLFEYLVGHESIKAQLPVVTDELQHHARGCYSVHAEIKRINRQCEQCLLAAEKWSAAANQILQRAVPVEALQHAWQNVLFHQFHDVITGTSIRKGMEDTKMFLTESLAIAEREQYQAIRAIANHVPIEDENGEFVVFNSLPWSRTGPIEIEYAFPFKENVVLEDDENRQFAHQELQRAELTNGSRKHWVFIDKLPPLGYKTYRWVAQEAAASHNDSQAEPIPEAGETWLENDRWRLEFDSITGYLLKCYDKRNRLDIIEGAAAVPLVFRDNSDTWSHSIKRYDKLIGAFSGAEVRLCEAGPVRVGLLITSYYENSIFRQKWMLYHRSETIDIELSIDWHEKHKLLKYSFPLNLQQTKAYSDQPYGHVERPNAGEEHPYQQWLTISGKTGAEKGNQPDYNFSLLNNGIYAYSLDKSNAMLTLLRSAIYAHHDPAKPDPDRVYDYSDQGRHDYKLTLMSHTGPALNFEVVRKANELNAAPYIFIDYAHPGYLPKHNSFLEIKAQNVIATVFKKAEDGDSFILRCYEVEGKAAAVDVTLGYNKISAQFKIQPYQIKTLQLKIVGDSLVIDESNALEE